MATPDQSGQDDVFIDNANTVGDFQVILHRLVQLLDRNATELDRATHGAEQQMAQLRTELAALAQRPVAHAQAETTVDLIDLRTMSPAVFSGERGETIRHGPRK